MKLFIECGLAGLCAGVIFLGGIFLIVPARWLMNALLLLLNFQAKRMTPEKRERAFEKIRKKLGEK